MRPQFATGQTGAFNLIEWRIVTGKKVSRVPGKTDLRLEVRTPNGEWRAVPMALGFLFADFHVEVEHRLYPRDNGFNGGHRFLYGSLMAVCLGWAAAVEWLEEERRKAIERRNGS